MKKSQRSLFLALWIAASLAAFLCIAASGPLGEFFSYIFLFPMRIFDAISGQDLVHLGPGTQAFLANSALVALAFMGVLKMISRVLAKNEKRRYTIT
jgi:hypothetical protein